VKTDLRRRLDDLIAEGTRPLGAFVMSSDPSTSAVFASAGYDFVVIDREHGMIDLAATVGHVRATLVSGASPVIRVLESTPTSIQKALDAGAHGIVVPKAEDADHVEHLVGATRYQPGGRGMCPTTPGAEFLGTDWASRAARHNENVLLIPLIETMVGVENAARIAAVNGVDYLFFGPADLAQDLGLDLHADRIHLQRIFGELRDSLRPIGARIGAPAGLGFDDADFLTIGSDLGHLRAKAAEGIATFRPAT
jgi:4-hydroxy-2-oxoheptanedioate aldolase